MAKNNRKYGKSARKDASERQKSYFKYLTGGDLPTASTRISAAAAITKALNKFMMVEKVRNLRRSEAASKRRVAPSASGDRRLISHSPRSLSHAADVSEIISGRLYAVEAGAFRSDLIRDITVLVDIDGGLPVVGARMDLIHVKWGAATDVDENLLAGVIRLCAASMHGREPRILIAGARDAIGVISAGILREYLGCDGATALGILKGCGLPIVKADLAKTVCEYRLS